MIFSLQSSLSSSLRGINFTKKNVWHFFSCCCERTNCCLSSIYRVGWNFLCVLWNWRWNFFSCVSIHQKKKFFFGVVCACISLKFFYIELIHSHNFVQRSWIFVRRRTYARRQIVWQFFSYLWTFFYFISFCAAIFAADTCFESGNLYVDFDVGSRRF